MLDLKDLRHLPALDDAIDRVVRERQGLIIVAGLDPRQGVGADAPDGMLPSGRATIFRILMRRLLPESARRYGRRPPVAVVAPSRDVVRLPHGLRREEGVYHLVNQDRSYEERIREAAMLRPGLLIVDRLDGETAMAVLEAAGSGLRVLAQMDTVFHGVEVANQLMAFGAAREALAALRWVVTVQRLPGLCPECHRPAAEPDLALLEQWVAMRGVGGRGTATPTGFEPGMGTFYLNRGCAQCEETGRRGAVAAFDIYHVEGRDPLEGTSLLSLEQYAYQLAAGGQVGLDALFRLDSTQLRQTYQLLVASERALGETNATLQRRLAQLEAANKVLEQRTEALISLHEMSQTLLSTAGLSEQAHRVSLQCCALSGADRAILYYLNTPERARVLASHGWAAESIPAEVDTSLLDVEACCNEPEAFDGPPPGVFYDAEREWRPLRAGLRVPLFAEEKLVGLMFVHTTRKDGFGPGEVALLQTFANQAALAIQRAGLIEKLQTKVAALEVAHAELARRERMEQELELARQVQQRMLPRTFPLIPGFQFATFSEPARRVGGDFYDVIPLDDDHFGVAVADVSDKGMPAALYMALTRSLLMAEARRSLSPAAVLGAVNDLLLRLAEPDMFVTVFYGVMQCSTRCFTYCRAGHDRPFLLRDGQAKQLDGPGIALGLLENEEMALTEMQIGLRPGDRLVLYSDGLTDVLAPDGRMYNRGLFQALLERHAALPPAKLCQVVFDTLSAYQGTAEQYDDMTMLVMGVG